MVGKTLTFVLVPLAVRRVVLGACQPVRPVAELGAGG